MGSIPFSEFYLFETKPLEKSKNKKSNQDIYAFLMLAEKTLQFLLRDPAINVPPHDRPPTNSTNILLRNLYFVDRKLTNRHFELGGGRERKDLSDEMTTIIDGSHSKALGVHFEDSSVADRYFAAETGIERQSLANSMLVAISFYKYLLEGENFQTFQNKQVSQQG